MRGNGADVEKCDERRATRASPTRRGAEAGGCGETAVLWGKNNTKMTQEPPHPHMHSVMTDKRGKRNPTCPSVFTVHAPRHHPALSPRCGPQHYITLCFCGAGRMCASYSLLRRTRSPRQPMSEALLFITRLGRTKIFFFLLAAGFISPASPLQELKYHFGSVNITSNQLMFGFCSCTVCIRLNAFLFCFFASCLHCIF